MKRLVSIAVLLGLILTLSACGKGGDASSASSSALSAPEGIENMASDASSDEPLPPPEINDQDVVLLQSHRYYMQYTIVFTAGAQIEQEQATDGDRYWSNDTATSTYNLSIGDTAYTVNPDTGTYTTLPLSDLTKGTGRTTLTRDYSTMEATGEPGRETFDGQACTYQDYYFPQDEKKIRFYFLGDRLYATQAVGEIGYMRINTLNDHIPMQVFDLSGYRHESGLISPPVQKDSSIAA